MALVTMRQLLDAAADGGYGLAAFNISDMEQLQAVMTAAHETESPVIVQATTSARRYAGDRLIVAMVTAAVEEHPGIPIALHHDHASSPAGCRSAIAAGFTSVMMDGSLREDGRTPSSFDYNVRVTREVVDMAHAVGVTVEGELGRIGGVEDGHGSGRGSLTDPDQAVEFVERTGVDALAVAIGTSHGASKFSRPPDRGILAMDLIAQIHELLPNVHLVMHGASSLPQDLVADINAHGGQLTPTWGVPVAEMQAGIRMGVRKINTDTDLRLAMTAGIRRTLEDNPALIDPRAYLGEARSAMTALVAQRMRDVGQAGHAGDIEPVTLAEMRRRYTAAGVSRT